MNPLVGGVKKKFSGWGGWKGDASLLFQCKSALTVLKRDEQGGVGRALRMNVTQCAIF